MNNTRNLVTGVWTFATVLAVTTLSQPGRRLDPPELVMVLLPHESPVANPNQQPAVRPCAIWENADDDDKDGTWDWRSDLGVADIIVSADSSSPPGAINYDDELSRLFAQRLGGGEGPLEFGLFWEGASAGHTPIHLSVWLDQQKSIPYVPGTPITLNDGEHVDFWVEGRRAHVGAEETELIWRCLTAPYESFTVETSYLVVDIVAVEIGSRGSGFDYATSPSHIGDNLDYARARPNELRQLRLVAGGREGSETLERWCYVYVQLTRTPPTNCLPVYVRAIDIDDPWSPKPGAYRPSSPPENPGSISPPPEPEWIDPNDLLDTSSTLPEERNRKYPFMEGLPYDFELDNRGKATYRNSQGLVVSSRHGVLLLESPTGDIILEQDAEGVLEFAKYQSCSAHGDVVLVPSMNPGDNYVVVAHGDRDAALDARNWDAHDFTEDAPLLDEQGVQVLDSDGEPVLTRVPVVASSSVSGYGPGLPDTIYERRLQPGKVSEPVAVWRTLHVEVKPMAAPVAPAELDSNQMRGLVALIGKTSDLRSDYQDQANQVLVISKLDDATRAIYYSDGTSSTNGAAAPLPQNLLNDYSERDATKVTALGRFDAGIFIAPALMTNPTSANVKRDFGGKIGITNPFAQILQLTDAPIVSIAGQATIDSQSYPCMATLFEIVNLEPPYQGALTLEFTAAHPPMQPSSIALELNGCAEVNAAAGGISDVVLDGDDAVAALRMRFVGSLNAPFTLRDDDKGDVFPTGGTYIVPGLAAEDLLGYARGGYRSAYLIVDHMVDGDNYMAPFANPQPYAGSQLTLEGRTVEIDNEPKIVDSMIEKITLSYDIPNVNARTFWYAPLAFVPEIVATQTGIKLALVNRGETVTEEQIFRRDRRADADPGGRMTLAETPIVEEPGVDPKFRESFQLGVCTYAGTHDERPQWYLHNASEATWAEVATRPLPTGMERSWIALETFRDLVHYLQLNSNNHVDGYTNADLQDDGPQALQFVVAHELGHTLGLGHQGHRFDARSGVPAEKDVDSLMGTEIPFVQPNYEERLRHFDQAIIRQRSKGPGGGL